MNGNFRDFIVEALQYTIIPSNENFSKAEKMFEEARQNKEFFHSLVSVIGADNMSDDIKLAAVCCLSKNLNLFFKADANLQDKELIENVLFLFKQDIFKLLTKFFDVNPMRNKLEECLKIVIVNIFPFYWVDLVPFLVAILKESGNLKEVYSATRGVLYIFSKYKNLVDDRRKPLEHLMVQMLPYVENLSMKLLGKLKMSDNLDLQSIKNVVFIFNVILKIFKAITNHEINQSIINIQTISTMKILKCGSSLLNPHSN